MTTPLRELGGRGGGSGMGGGSAKALRVQGGGGGCPRVPRVGSVRGGVITGQGIGGGGVFLHTCTPSQCKMNTAMQAQLTGTMLALCWPYAGPMLALCMLTKSHNQREKNKLRFHKHITFLYCNHSSVGGASAKQLPISNEVRQVWAACQLKPPACS